MRTPLLLLLLLLALAPAAALAETQYVSDALTVTLRNNPVSDGKPVGTPLAAGNPVDVLQRSPDGRWARVRFQQYEGWLPTAQLQRDPGARDRLQDLQGRLDAMTREHESAIARARQLESDNEALKAQLAQTQAERDAALREFGDLKINAANPQQLAARSNSLQAQVAQLTIDNERLQAEITRQDADRSTRFFLYGGLLVLLALFMGWLLARPARRAGGW